MSLWQEFKSFIVQGNAMDLAVGVILGTAFGKIVTSLVSDVLMPPIGLAIQGVDFKELRWVLQPRHVLANGAVSPEISILYGQFIQAMIDFVLISFCVFMLIKAVQTLRKQPPPKAADAPPPPEDVKLLTEIRDLLAKKA